MSFFDLADMSKRQMQVESTWEHKRNLTLYEQIKLGTLKVIQEDEEPILEQKKQLPKLRKAAGMEY